MRRYAPFFLALLMREYCFAVNDSAFRSILRDALRETVAATFPRPLLLRFGQGLGDAKSKVVNLFIGFA